MIKQTSFSSLVYDDKKKTIPCELFLAEIDALIADKVVAELVRAGFSGFFINGDLLPYQFIIEAY